MVLNHHPHSHVVTHDRPKAASHPQWHLCPRLSRSARPPWRPLLPLSLSPPSHLSPPSAHPMAAPRRASQRFPPPAWPAAACSHSRLLCLLLDSTAKLLASGATAVGGVSVLSGVTAEMVQAHLDGQIPNPSGGVEAIISHLISKVFRVPTAHAPLPYYAGMKAEHATSSVKRAAEHARLRALIISVNPRSGEHPHQ